jgi:hypothetical protein
MTMQTGLEELTEKAQRQSTEAAAQVKEATGRPLLRLCALPKLLGMMQRLKQANCNQHANPILGKSQASRFRLRSGLVS